ncbi:MAG: TIGR03618 family F420-dependent PPOX class oxidoreductase [Chloroflexi bacterium]|nr:TIGR03618 family F420-dependent PPOX class oxidoreductase [Chloroflexota bacterium]
MTPEERKKLLEENRYCVVGYNRNEGPPALSPVYYVMDGDDILISTQAGRAKGRVLARNPEVSVCILSEKHPSAPYITVYGRAKIEKEGAVDLMMRIGGVMTGSPVSEAVRPAIEKRAEEEGRVVLRISPESYIGRD